MQILHLDDVLPHIEGRKDFVVKSADGYTVVDYVVAGPDTFDHPMRRECRGIKFGPDGVILARPFHKFFNVGERDETQPDRIDWGRPHVVVEKLDGSMIHPAFVNRRLRFMTRMGLTDVAERCENLWLRAIEDRCFDLYSDGATPIFEWTSPMNRIVVGYPDDRLTLIGVRDIVTGRYRGWRDLEHIANRAKWPLPRVLATDAYGDWHGLARYCEGLEDQEGFVVWFDDGNAVKVKAPWYVSRHRALDGLRWEHHVTRLVLEDGVDDVLPLLSDADHRKLSTFASDLRAAIDTVATGIETVVELIRNEAEGDRKQFALGVKARFIPFLQGIAFRVYDGASAYVALRDMVLKNCTDQARCRAALEAVGGPRWN